MLNDRFGVTVEARRRFVQHEDRSSFEHRARDRNPLSLSSAKTHPAISDTRFEALRATPDEIAAMGLLGSSLHFLASRRGTAVTNIFQDGIVEKKSILSHERH